MTTAAAPLPAWLVQLGDRVAAHPQLLASLPRALADLPFASEEPKESQEPLPDLPAPTASWTEHQHWLHAQIRRAVKALFDAGVATEPEARPAIHAYLLAAAGQGVPAHATRAASKRKRPMHSDPESDSESDIEASDPMPPPTPISELYVPPPPNMAAGETAESVEAAQLWTQLELRHAGLDGLCERAVQMEQNEEDDEEADERIAKAEAEANSEDDEEGLSDEDASDEDLARLAAMTDAQLKAIGFAPREIFKVRAELRQRGFTTDASGAPRNAEEAALEDAELEELEDMSDEELDGPEEEGDEGFPGASDLSDAEEATRVTIEPLQDEEEQLRRKDMFGVDPDSDSDDDSQEEEDEEEEDGRSDAEPSAAAPSSSLDDGFFNLAAFQRDTLAAEAKEPEADVDLFADPSTWASDGEDDEGDDMMYDQFFAPPASAAGRASHKPAAKGMSTAKTNDKTAAPAPPSASAGRGRIRFFDQVQVRRIKRAPGMRGTEGWPPLPAILGESGMDIDSDGDDEASEDEAEDVEDEHQDSPSPSQDEEEMVLDTLEKNEEEESDNDAEGSDAGSVEDTARRVAQDLFADDDFEDGPDTQSTHEKRQAALEAEISALEAENVGNKVWEMRGEASGSSRPKDAALEMDIDFVHALKSAPLATAEQNEAVEDLIKRRVLAGEFDDVPRRLAISEKEFLPSKLASLSDQKSQQSLAELYEQEYAQAQAGGAPTNEADSKLAAEHEQLTALVENVFQQLDRLSNAHYTPRVTDVHTGQITAAPSGGVAAMASEQALPLLATSSQATQQAPREVYDPSSRNGVAVPGSHGARVSRSFAGVREELTSQEKKKEHAHLRRLKRARTQGNSALTAKPKGVRAEKDAALQSLATQPGVSVVGADGQRNTMVKKRGTLERAKALPPAQGGQLKL